MAGRSKKNRASVQTFRYSKGLAIRLEYDPVDQRQSVFLNNELRSSFNCAIGEIAEHIFRSHDEIAEKNYWESTVWRVQFAAEHETSRIRYRICCRDGKRDDDDAEWYWCDENASAKDWFYWLMCFENTIPTTAEVEAFHSKWSKKGANGTDERPADLPDGA